MRLRPGLVMSAACLAAAGVEELGQALPVDDDACAAPDDGSCALSLRQLRAKGSSAGGGGAAELRTSSEARTAASARVPADVAAGPAVAPGAAAAAHAERHGAAVARAAGLAAQAWRTADADGDGRLSAVELEADARRWWPHGRASARASVASTTSAARLVAALDADADGALDAGEAVAASSTAGAEAAEGRLLREALLARAATNGSISQQVLEAALSGKADDSRCANAPEGQTCVSNNAFVYCSNHKRLSAGETNCESTMGRLSHCVSDGTGLAIGRCDDPFCRNGGAYAGDGRYCHNTNVVRCNGEAEPEVSQSCSSRSRYGSGSCQVTDHYTCRGGHPDPYCAFDHTSTSGSDCGSTGYDSNAYSGYGYNAYR